MRAVSPTGSPIVGTWETVPGVAQIDEHSWSTDDAGRVAFDYGGWTEIDWNGQETITTRRGWRIFVDEDGRLWSERRIRLVDPSAEPDA